MENRKLTYKEAVEHLDFHMEKRKKRVHTFKGFGGILMGCDMDVTAVKRLFRGAKKDELLVSGPSMLGMGHGIAVLQEDKGWLFIESKDIDEN